MDELVAWLRAQLDEDEQVAQEASRRRDDGWTPTGEHWHWVEPERDQPLTLDPVVDEHVNVDGRADLRSVEEYPTNMPYTLPHFVVPHTEELRTVDAMHIARWDPARVLAEVEAKRRTLDAWRAANADPHPGIPCENWPGQGAENRDPYDSCTHHLAAPPRTPDHVVRLLAQPYAGRPGWREEWRA